MGAMGDSRLAPGSDADFDRLYRQSYGRILGTLRAMLRDLAAAEDCAQETFVDAYRAWSRWSPDAPAEAWLHRIAVNKAISLRRREQLRRPSELARRVGTPPPAPDPFESNSPALLAALRRLPPDQAAVIVLRHLHGYTNREIAVAIRAPESTVSSRLAAAKAKLAAELADAGVAVAAPPVVAAEAPRVDMTERPQETSQTP